MRFHSPGSGYKRDHKNTAVPGEISAAVRAYTAAAAGNIEILAEQTGLRPAQISQIARGQHSKSTDAEINRIAEILGVYIN